YVIVQGNPVASGRIDYASPDGTARLGVWRCTEGVFDCNELGDELQTILQGRLILTLEGQAPIECIPGDSIFTRKGQRVRWDIQETVVKLFHTSNLDNPF
ncbi:MAG: cupin domain-containing protein, partial [Pseudomonadota bacterium]|nr:cupin domain-containing protein [Pseudomonadota bacterium]